MQNQMELCLYQYRPFDLPTIIGRPLFCGLNTSVVRPGMNSVLWFLILDCRPKFDASCLSIVFRVRYSACLDQWLEEIYEVASGFLDSRWVRIRSKG